MKVVSMIFIVLVMLSFGCAKGNPYEDKVGIYTYPNALSDLGPADSCEQSGQNKVCSWTTGVNKNWVDKIILVFGPDSVLISGKEKRF